MHGNGEFFSVAVECLAGSMERDVGYLALLGFASKSGEDQGI